MLTAALVFAAGLVSVSNRPVEYTADARVLITPKSGEDPIRAADTISRGSVVATFAEAYGSDVVVTDAMNKAGIPVAAQDRVSVTARSLSGPSVLEIEASADDPILAEAAANAVASSKPDLDGYSDAFGSRVIADATGSAVRTGASGSVLIALLLAASAACGIAVATVSMRFGRSRAESRALREETRTLTESPAVPEEERRPEWISGRS